MPRRFRLFAHSLILAVGLVTAVSASVQDERVAASFLLALGRTPTTAEAATWSRSGERSVDQLMAVHAAKLREDPSARIPVFRRAFLDTFGRAPTAAEAASATEHGFVYTEWMNQNLQVLAIDADRYAEVIQRAYKFVINRDAYDEEIAYWREHGTLTYAMLVGCVEDWARRNQPGLMVTAGDPVISINCEFLSVARLSPAVAAEARAAAALPNTDTDGGNLLAVGSAAVRTSGKMHFAAAGTW